MKKLLIAAFVLMQTSVFAQSTWKADKAHSRLGFTITHLGINDVAGAFNNFDVTMTAAKEDFSDAVIEMTADVASIDTGIEPRDKHLKSPDFFNADANPKMTFKSTSVKKSATNKYKVTGNLTLNGVTKPVTMDLWYRGTIENPMSKKPTAGFQLTGTIKRSDFNFGSKYGAPMLSHEVMIRADGEFAKQ